MRDLRQVLKENNVTEEQLYQKYLIYQKHNNKNHNCGMSMHMSFNKNELFVLASLGLNFLEDALKKRPDYSLQKELFDAQNLSN